MCQTKDEIDQFPNKKKRGCGKLGDRDLKVCRRYFLNNHTLHNIRLDKKKVNSMKSNH